MKSLIIETSGEKSFVMLAIDGKWSQVFLPLREQSQHLLPAVDQLLSTNYLKLDDLDFIAAGKGPGSFTGTRVGVLTAKTLCFAKNLPLISFCSLSRFLPEENTPFLLLIDAKSQGFYIYDGKKAYLSPLDTLHIQENQLLLSPHPDRIEKRLSLPITLATLNLPFLINHLEKQFLTGQTVSPHTLQVSYLHNP